LYSGGRPAKMRVAEPGNGGPVLARGSNNCVTERNRGGGVVRVVVCRQAVRCVAVQQKPGGGVVCVTGRVWQVWCSRTVVQVWVRQARNAGRWQASVAGEPEPSGNNRVGSAGSKGQRSAVWEQGRCGSVRLVGRM